MFALRYCGSTCRGASLFVGHEITTDEYLYSIPWLFSTDELAYMLQCGEAEFMTITINGAA